MRMGSGRERMYIPDVIKSIEKCYLLILNNKAI